MATLEEKEARVIEATTAGYRGSLQARGAARAMIWRNGTLPDNAPGFSNLLSYDLLSYGYALLSDGLDILEEGGNADVAREAFTAAAGAIESVVANGVEDEDRDFHRLVAAAAYHLARFSARSYSMLHQRLEDANLSVPERALSLLMLREMDALEALIVAFKRSDTADDDNLARLLANAAENSEEEGDIAGPFNNVLDTALTDGFMSALAYAMLAFERGEPALIQAARERLGIGQSCAADLNFVPHWWCHRLAFFLIGDLWSLSFHTRLPITSPEQATAHWSDLRELFIASLYKRRRAEIELWPSQLGAAERALDLSDNLVVSLPTSAGKTRIAELCILACLASGKRVVFITPLRALSAQTEVGLTRTFGRLGKSVSSLYGSIGVGNVEQNILRERSIIVATPEKLDFALRNEPDLLDDVGLVVLDEGHMIGLGEREVRYEVQIQKLLQRHDAGERRIICLSAILPSDDKLDDFVDWLTDEADKGLIQKDWRPTRLRFGYVEWRKDHGRLQLLVGDERPFVPRFIEQRFSTKGRRKLAFPNDQRELCLATAWQLVDDGQSVLIFCPLRRSVEPYAGVIVDLHGRGLLRSLLEADEAVLSSALAIGKEWFNENHAILSCLKLGIAVHHGALPTPFRREVERLLREGVLKVTISSPTLAQGLNLSATALIFHGLDRNRDLIDISEFRNVIGRAGRAFVDLEGLVLFPMLGDIRKKKSKWKRLIEDSAGKEMESGLLLMVQYLLARMVRKHKPANLSDLREYVINGAYWEFSELPGESKRDEDAARSMWPGYVAMLDTAILGLIGNQDIADDDIEAALDSILQSSLWTRRLQRQTKRRSKILRAGLIGRARYIWANTSTVQRRAYFLAGVGLKTGAQLDAQASELVDLMIQANGHIASGDEDEAITAIIAIAEILFEIPPFTPKITPADWRSILTAWLRGAPISTLARCDDPETLSFIEDALIYRLPWGMEATRVRALAHAEPIADDFSVTDFELGLAVPAIETGTLDVAAALLMKSGFASRSAAIKVIEDTDASFQTLREMRQWLGTELVKESTGRVDWPTPETAPLWKEFVASMGSGGRAVWKKSSARVPVIWNEEAQQSGTAVRLLAKNNSVCVTTADFKDLGVVEVELADFSKGIVCATVATDSSELNIEFVGPAPIR